MKFRFKGRLFRIVFQHDLSRAWSDHMGHSVRIGRFAAKTGKIVLWCSDCKTIIGNVPKRLRQRETHCSIEECVAGVLPVDSEWRILAAGSSRTNRKAGDRFERRAGREAALQNARQNLGMERPIKLTKFNLPLEFLDAINEAYYYPGNIGAR